VTADLTPERTAELRALLDAGTARPWRWAGNIDTGEPRLTGRGCDVLAIGYDHRSTAGRDADEVRAFARESQIDEDEAVDTWANDQYGEPIKEPRLWFYTDHMADPARDNVVFEVAPNATDRDDPKVYRADITDIRHPDARLIAAAVNALGPLLDRSDRLATLEDGLREQVADFRSEVDWSNGRSNYGDNAAWESAASRLSALLDGGEG
jgi:hypothetical protein